MYRKIVKQTPFDPGPDDAAELRKTRPVIVSETRHIDIATDRFLTGFVSLLPIPNFGTAIDDL